MKVKLIVDGGSMQPGPAVAQQLGPMGINLGKVISDVNAATSGFKGVKVPVEIDVNGKTKTYEIKVFSPPTAELIKKELGLEKGSGEALKTKVGNIAFERIIHIANTKLPNLLAKNLKSAVKLVVGTCVSLGVLIDNKEPKEIESDIDEGKYDSEIKAVKTEVSAEKKKDIEAFFADVKDKQEKAKKAAEEAAAAAEAAKVAAEAVAATTATTTPGATPAEGAPATGKEATATGAKAPVATGKPATGKEAAKPEAKPAAKPSKK